MRTEFPFSSEVLQYAYSSKEMWPSMAVGREQGPFALNKFEFYTETGRNMLKVLRENFRSKYPDFNSDQIISEMQESLKLSEAEQQSLFNIEKGRISDDQVLDSFIAFKSVEKMIKPELLDDYLPKLFRTEVPVYNGKTRLEMLSFGFANYMMGQDYWEFWVTA